MKIKYAGVALAASALLFAAGCSSTSDDTAMEPSPAASAENSAAAGTIVDVAAADENFTTLVKAVQAAGLVETLSGDTEYTVFAPTNEAFEQLDAEVLNKLLEPDNKDALAKVLKYHVVPGKVTSDMIEPGKVTTVEGQDVTVSVEGETVKVNDATVTTADIATSNGVIHVIDAVILPPDVDPAAL